MRPAVCVRADGRATSIAVERELGFRYELGRGGAGHYQEICPACRRALFGLAKAGGALGSGERIGAKWRSALRGLSAASSLRERMIEWPRFLSTSWRSCTRSDRTCRAGTRGCHRVEPERLVKTHCCFCGQQCGIQLKVRGNEVIGFEPWEEFPFNHGMLCPKGVKRYLQGAHPDGC